jgi:type I restriction enzyme S subunit
MNSPLLKTVGEVCDFVGGSQPAKSFFSSEKLDGYIRLIQIRDYKSDNFKTYIPKDSTKKFCTKDDIMIGRYGPPIFQILRGIEGAYNVALMKAIPKENITNDFLYYFLCQEELFNYINALSPRTGGQTGVDVFMLKKYPIRLPSIEVQKQIAKVLSDLDAKIEVNNKINATLEALAKTIYDYWFVQFDFPCPEALEGQEHLAGKPYKSSGGKMMYNEELKREIPEGWEVKPLSKVIEIFDSQRIPLSKSVRETMVGDIPYYGATSIMGYVNDFIFDDDYILLAEDGSIMDDNGFPIVQFIWGKTWVNNHAHVIQAKNKEHNEFVFQLLKMIPVVLIKTGSIQMKINQENLKNHKVLIPTLDLIEKYSKKASVIRKQLINNSEQNQKLAALRDWLLPMLMNGQVRIEKKEDQEVDLNLAAESAGTFKTK